MSRGFSGYIYAATPISHIFSASEKQGNTNSSGPHTAAVGQLLDFFSLVIPLAIPGLQGTPLTTIEAVSVSSDLWSIRLPASLMMMVIQPESLCLYDCSSLAPNFLTLRSNSFSPLTLDFLQVTHFLRQMELTVTIATFSHVCSSRRYTQMMGNLWGKSQ